MTPEELLRRLEGLDPAGTVTVGWLLAELGHGGAAAPRATLAASVGDLSCREAGLILGRAASTVRGWLEAGVLQGYRQRGREWRIPRAALDRFRERERTRTTAPEPASSGRRGKSIDLGAWRRSAS